MGVQAPNAAFFRTPVLSTLSRHQEFVELDDEFGVQVLKGFGLDLERLHVYGSPKQGWTLPTLISTVNKTVRILARNYGHVETLPTGWVRLTPLGAAQLKIDRGLEARGPNKTSQYLARVTPELAPFLERFLRRKMPRSSFMDIEDHVQNCLTRLISRDSLRIRLALGLPIEFSHVAMWAARSSYTDARDAAMNPVTRELWGARTVKERQCPVPEYEIMVAPRQVVTKSETPEAPWIDIRDEDSSMTADALEDALAFDALWDQIQSRVHARVGAQAARVIQLRYMGHTHQEIATQENLPRSKVNGILNDSRRHIRPLLETHHEF